MYNIICIFFYQTVQPDSHCKFKTTLAIEYVRDILEENATNSRPAKRQNTLKKTGQMKQLLGGGLSVLEPNVTKCLGIQNGNDRIKPGYLRSSQES